MSQAMNKRDLIINRINEGNATKADLMTAAGLEKAEGFASQLSYIRMRALAVAEVAPEVAKFPMVNDEGIWYMGSYEEYLAGQNTKSGSVGGPKTRTTADALAFAQKREDKASAAYTKANEKSLANPDDEIFRLTAEMKKIELDIASRKLAMVEQGNCQYESFIIDDTAAPATEEAPVDVEDVL